LRRRRNLFRERRLALVSRGRLDAELAYDQMDSMRWLHRVCYHLWRIVHHLERARFPEGRSPEQTPVLPEDED